MCCTGNLITDNFAQRMCEAQEKMEREQRESIINFLKHEKDVHVRIKLREILNTMMIETVATSGPGYYFDVTEFLKCIEIQTKNVDKIVTGPNCLIEYRINPLHPKQVFYFINYAYH